MILYLQSFALALVAGSILHSVTWRRSMTVTVIGAWLLLLITPAPAPAQNLLGVIQAVLNVINNVIGPLLGGITNIRTGVQNFYQQTLWPQNLIGSNQQWFVAMGNQFYGPFENDFLLPTNSATLPAPQALEQLLLSRNAGNVGPLGGSYSQVYGPLPPTTQVSAALLARMDMDDALAQDGMKQALVFDQAQTSHDQAATSLETAGPNQAPGSAPFNTAGGTSAQLRSALTQLRLAAAMLRAESAKLADDNFYRKESARQAQRLQNDITVVLP